MSVSPNKTKLFLYLFAVVMIALIIGCAGPTAPAPSQIKTPPPAPKPQLTRAETIPASAVKMTPELDTIPPLLHSDEYENPIPLSRIVNTAGAEDSAFMMPDGNTLYFFFTPDASVPAEKQLFDGVTGIYVAKKHNGDWAEPQRVWLQDPQELSLDGCEFVQGDIMWFCSARQGNYRDMDMWTAEFQNGKWANWKNAGKKLNVDYEIGEMHVTSDGSELYFHSGRAGGKGNYDIWVTEKVNDEWQEPKNVEVVNTADNEGWPFITQDGNELWFIRTYLGTPGIFRSKKVGGEWSQPELIISQFAAEPSLDSQGNVYFTHHFFKDNKMIEADIYVAYRK